VGSQVIDKRIVPGTPGEEGPGEGGPATHSFEGVGFVVVGGEGCASFIVGGIPTVLEEDDGDGGGACGVKDFVDAGDQRGGAIDGA